MPTAIVLQAKDSVAPAFHLAPLDWVGLVVIGVPILLGIWRGLWWQVIRFVGILAAVALARAFSLPVAEVFAERWGGDFPPRVLFGAAWLIVFLLSLGAATVLGLLGQKLLDAMQLGLANRFGGGLVGAATGVILHLALLAVLVQLSSAEFIGRNVSGTYSERLVKQLGLAFPAVFSVQAAEEVRDVLGIERLGDADRDEAPRSRVPSGDTSSSTARSGRSRVR